MVFMKKILHTRIALAVEVETSIGAAVITEALVVIATRIVIAIIPQEVLAEEILKGTQRRTVRRITERIPRRIAKRTLRKIIKRSTEMIAAQAKKQLA
jgi:hypothetical protein